MDAMHRKAVESHYTGSCSIYEYERVTDEKTKLTKNQEVLKLENQLCRLSYSGSPVAVASNNATSRAQEVKMFLAPEIEVKAGSKIVVTQNGVTAAYCKSGEPAIYSSHQEIRLELFKEWT